MHLVCCIKSNPNYQREKDMCKGLLIMGCTEAAAALGPLLGPFAGVIYLACVGGVVLCVKKHMLIAIKQNGSLFVHFNK